MNFLFIIKIAGYLAICIGAAFLFEQLADKGNFYRYILPFFISIVFGIGLCIVMNEEWYFGIGGAALMLIIGSCSNYSLFGDKNNPFKIVVLISAAIIMIIKFAVLDPITVNIATKSDPRIGELNDTVYCYGGGFRLEGYEITDKSEKRFNVEDFPKPYYFSYLDDSDDNYDSDFTGFASMDFPCIPTKENLGEIKTLVYAVKHTTSGVIYDKYINGVKTNGQKTFYNYDISFLILNLDTKECYQIKDGLFGFDAKYVENQKNIGKSDAEKYIKNLYKKSYKPSNSKSQ